MGGCAGRLRQGGATRECGRWRALRVRPYSKPGHAEQPQGQRTWMPAQRCAQSQPHIASGPLRATTTRGAAAASATRGCGLGWVGRAAMVPHLGLAGGCRATPGAPPTEREGGGHVQPLRRWSRHCMSSTDTRRPSTAPPCPPRTAAGGAWATTRRAGPLRGKPPHDAGEGWRCGARSVRGPRRPVPPVLLPCPLTSQPHTAPRRRWPMLRRRAWCGPAPTACGRL